MEKIHTAGAKTKSNALVFLNVMQIPINSCVFILWFIRFQLDVRSKTDAQRKLKPKPKVESVYKLLRVNV